MKGIVQLGKYMRRLGIGCASRFQILAAAVVIYGATCSAGWAQTASTGAVTGMVSDQTGAAVPNVHVVIVSESSGATRKAVTGGDGVYHFPLLPPGTYSIQATTTGFKLAVRPGVPIQVTETTSLNIELQLGSNTEQVMVQADPEMTQIDSNALGRVTDQKSVHNLPLVTRNFTQIIGLSPGVNVGLTDATQLGSGTGGMSNYTNEDISVNGARSFDNGFLMDGLPANDLAARWTQSGGIAIPNPDSIAEFKVLTGQYDASYGRNAGANVNVITKSGSNQLHGNLFEFFRNEDLNANSYFFNNLGVPRGILRQNQFGGTMGGPIKRDKLLYFGSYQGTRQLNGVSTGCSSTFVGPPLTNDRSAAALGAIFGGQAGTLGGVAVAQNGSNISPVALALLNLKLPDGNYVVPTPRQVTGGQGQYAFSIPCTFSEDQFVTNVDYLQSERSKFTAKFFFSDQSLTQALPYATVPGSPADATPHFRNLALTHDYIFNATLLNQMQVGYHRISNPYRNHSSFNFPQIGSTAIPQSANYAEVSFGQETVGALENASTTSNAYTVQDALTYSHGRHSLRFGGGVTRTDLNYNILVSSFLIFLSAPDFLLGESAAQNGSPFSNVYFSYDLPGQLNRNWIVWNPWAYAEDDFRLHSRLTLNLGLRYERPGYFGDKYGRNSSFDPALADSNPPPSGSQAGYVLSSNFQGAIPTGSIRLNNHWGIRGDGQNTISPRIGIAWQVLPSSSRLVLRTGYGIYYSTFIGEEIVQTDTSPPFSELRESSGTSNAGATFANPFGPLLSPSDFPIFPSYSPSTQASTAFVALNARPPLTQQYSLNLQAQLASNYMLEIGYVGSRGEHLVEQISRNQAGLASASSPIRGETTNTLANLPLRVPFVGFQPTGLDSIQTTGDSKYNSLQVSVTKRFSQGLQLLSYYSFSRLLDTSGGQTDGVGSGSNTAIGNQYDPRARYGATASIRPHRFVTSFGYDVPRMDLSPMVGKILNDWAVYGVVTVQSGHPLTILSTNANNVYGINGSDGDFAEFAPGCNKHLLETRGGVKSKLNNYFNQGCIGSYPIVGDDGIATGFGNMGTGIVNGPGQGNVDLAITKRVPVGWFGRESNWEFRSEFFNAFNKANFGDPDTNVTDGAAFGVITGTIANPRVIQFALKYNF